MMVKVSRIAPAWRACLAMLLACFFASSHTSASVVVWGDNSSGQGNVPSDLGEVTAIDSGDSHVIALKADGSVAVWGGSPLLLPPAGLSSVTAVAAGSLFNAALKSNGSVEVWGSNEQGQCDVPADLGTVTAISAGGAHTVALKSDGTVRAWGLNDDGQCNVPANLNGVVAVSAGIFHTMALKSDGTVVVWGGNQFGQRTPPENLNGVTSISAGGINSVALKSDGTVVVWGYDLDGQTTPPSTLVSPTAISAGYLHIVALNADGTVVGWGASGWAQTNVPADLGTVIALAAGSAHTAALVADPPPPTVFITPAIRRAPAAGGSFELQLDSDVEWTWSSGGTSWLASTELATQTGDATFSYSLAANPYPYPRTAFITFTGGSYSVRHTVIQSPGVSGSVIAWGRNTDYQVEPTGLTNAVALAGGRAHSVALRSDGTVVAWGLSAEGSNINAVPSGLGDVVAIDSSGDHTVALKSDGTVLAWGDNTYGQNNVPSGLSGVVSVATSGAHVLALKGDGTVVAWGLNNTGQASVPPDLKHVIAIDAGGSHSLVLRDDGSFVEWGELQSGIQPPPGGGSGYLAVATNGSYAAALKADGTLDDWGNSPLPSTGRPEGLIALRLGAHALALKADGTVTGWGSNTWGQLTPPPGLRSVVALADGGFHSLALVDASFLPEIAIRGNAVDIPSGDTSPSPSDLTDFGMVTLTGGKQHIYSVANTGTGPLYLGSPSAVSISGAHASDFSVQAQPSSSVPQRSAASFSLYFHPAASGLRTATVTIASNDPDTPSYAFAIRGQGISPRDAFDLAMQAAGLAGANAEPDAEPFHDGVSNLLKYAFNLDPSGPATAILLPGTGVSGLPSVISSPGLAGDMEVKIEFVRRIGSGLLYQPKLSDTLQSGSWDLVTQPPLVTPIDATWERVRYSLSLDPQASPKTFVKVDVSLP